MLRETEARKLKIKIDFENKITLRGYGNGHTVSIGSSLIEVVVDEVDAQITVAVVKDCDQDVAIIIGRNFTELPHIIVVKNDTELIFFKKKE